MTRAHARAAVAVGLAALAAGVLVTSAGGCGGPADPPAPVCTLGPDEPTPDAVGLLGCPSDYARLGYEDDPFGAFAHTNTVNVVIDRRDGGRVYFLDTATWWLHFDFVWVVLQGRARDEEAYTAAQVQFSLDNYVATTSRRYILGKVVQYLDSDHVVFEMAAGDAAGAELIIEGFRAVRARLFDGEALRFRPVANGQEQLIPALEPHIPVVTTAELLAGQTYQPLNRTVGYGTLRFRRLSSLAAEPPLPTEILVLDAVPNDIPTVSGLITAEFQTPLSHVNILSKQRGTPNMALRGAWDAPVLRGFEGRLVKLTVDAVDFGIEPADAAAAQAWWETLRPDEPLVPESDLSSDALVELSASSPASATPTSRIGAKASNFAELLRIVPRVPVPEPAFALPFALFDRHMTEHGLWAELDGILADAPTGDELARRLFALRWRLYQAPMDPALRDALAAHVSARFGATPVRFRSSTNVEDLVEFSGAGIYTSAGASSGDGPEAIERAVKVVWASAFNYGAFVERDFYRVDHRRVMMGVLFHPAFKDELANGVALTLNEFSALRPGYFINAQAGEVSVTNPTGEAVPEQIIWYSFYEGLPQYYEVVGRSSLTGGEPVLADDEYSELAGYLERVRVRFRLLHCVVPGSEPTQYIPGCEVDVEWKLAADGELYLKQARPLRAR